MAGERYTMGFKDYSRESASMSIKVGSVTAVSLPGLLSDIDDFRAATDALTLGTIQTDQLTAFKTNITTAYPTNANAQRERKWLVSYVDNTQFFDDPVNAIPNEGYGRTFVLEIPTADLTTTLLLGTTDFANLAATAWATWVTAFQAIARSPHGGEVLVTEAIAVGRNS